MAEVMDNLFPQWQMVVTVACLRLPSAANCRQQPTAVSSQLPSVANCRQGQTPGFRAKPRCGLASAKDLICMLTGFDLHKGKCGPSGHVFPEGGGAQPRALCTCCPSGSSGQCGEKEKACALEGPWERCRRCQVQKCIWVCTSPSPTLCATPSDTQIHEG